VASIRRIGEYVVDRFYSISQLLNVMLMYLKCAGKPSGSLPVINFAVDLFFSGQHIADSLVEGEPWG
jgi:hypothetical protein